MRLARCSNRKPLSADSSGVDAYGQWQALGLLTDQLLCLEGLCSYLNLF